MIMRYEGAANKKKIIPNWHTTKKRKNQHEKRIIRDKMQWRDINKTRCFLAGHKTVSLRGGGPKYTKENV